MHYIPHPLQILIKVRFIGPLGHKKTDKCAAEIVKFCRFCANGGTYGKRSKNLHYEKRNKSGRNRGCC